MTVDTLWFQTTQANQRAEQAYHGLCERYDDFLEFSRRTRVSKRRFRTLVSRISQSGAPYGAHTIVYRSTGELLLVRHDGVDLWVLPGGEVGSEETFREAAARELAEEAGVSVSYDGLAMTTRVDIECGDHSTWGVVPVFAARAESVEPDVSDPDGEITAARWFDELPSDTRDRAEVLQWRETALT